MQALGHLHRSQKCFFTKSPDKFLGLECAAYVVMELGLLTQTPHKIRSHGFGVAQCARQVSHGLFHLAHSVAFQPTTLFAETSASTSERSLCLRAFTKFVERIRSQSWEENPLLTLNVNKLQDPQSPEPRVLSSCRIFGGLAVAACWTGTSS